MKEIVRSILWRREKRLFLEFIYFLSSLFTIREQDRVVNPMRPIILVEQIFGCHEAARQRDSFFEAAQTG